jgi:hypothetical protein
MRGVFVAVFAAIVGVAPVYATDVTFSGTVTGVCSLALATPGLLGLSTAGTILGSEEPGGVSATLTIVSIGTNTVTVGAPTRTAEGVGYNASGEAVEVAYTGQAGLNTVTHAYGPASSNFQAGTLPLTELVINSRIRNLNGFPAGTYGTKTVVTCSP